MTRRGLRQQLEALSLAGLTHLPRSHKAARNAVPETPIAVAAPVIRALESHPPAADAVASRAPAIRNETAVAASAEALVSPEGAAPKQPLSLAERQSVLTVLNDRVRACTRCEILARTRKQTVFGVGNPEARVLFLGEAPGADEDARGEPFVGRAGQLLNQIITASKLVREQIYICNVLKCRPPENRTPNDDECANCREFLLGQLATIDPEYIVCWGAVAARNLLSTTLGIGKLRGRFFKYVRAKVLVTYHPSYLLRNPAAKKDVWEDMKFLMADMGGDLSK